MIIQLSVCCEQPVLLCSVVDYMDMFLINHCWMSSQLNERWNSERLWNVFRDWIVSRREGAMRFANFSQKYIFKKWLERLIEFLSYMQLYRGNDWVGRVMTSILRSDVDRTDLDQWRLTKLHPWRDYDGYGRSLLPVHVRGQSNTTNLF